MSRMRKPNTDRRVRRGFGPEFKTGAVRLVLDEGKTVGVYALNEPNPLFPGTLKDCATDGPSEKPAPGHYRLLATITSGTLTLKAEHGFTFKADGEVIKDAEKEAHTP